jgi:hypothetical protein
MNQLQKDTALRKGLVKTKIVKVLHEATIMHVGWEADNKGWIVQCEDGKVKALTTNHGRLCMWSGKDMHATLKQTQQSVAEIEEAINLMVNK